MISKNFGFIFSFLLCVVSGASADYKGFVQVRPDLQMYVEYKTAQKNFPTLILINGLTYSTQQYGPMAKTLAQAGYGVLRFDLQGMGQTLLKYAPSLKPYPIQNQIADMDALLRALDLRPPYQLAGLSYGGAVAMAYALEFPNKVKNLILMAPYTQPLESQDNWIKSQIWLTRKTYPGNPVSDDELYDFYLHQIVYATYPQAEPIVLENPFKLEAVYNLVRGIRKFRPVDEIHQLSPKISVHLMVGEYDQYINKKTMDEFWTKVPRSSQKSQMVVRGSEHKIPEVYPEFTALWVAAILQNKAGFNWSLPLLGNPKDLTVTDGQKTIRLK